MIRSTDQQPKTRLGNKHYSPMIIRKYTRWGPPLYIALITDDNLDDLDEVIHSHLNPTVGSGSQWPTSIQGQRDLAGGLVDMLINHYEHVEGAAVVLYADKMFVSSLHGDFMTHLMCRLELYTLLQMSTGV